MRLRPCLAALSNRHFDNILVPIGTRHAEYLPRYAGLFDALELAQLYHDPVPDERVLGWLEQAPDGFTFPVKLWKSAVAPTDVLGEPLPWDHRALGAADEALDALKPVEAAGKRGPIVAQFPPRFAWSNDHAAWLDALLSKRPAGSFAVEFRNTSWNRDDVEALLTRHKAALVWGTHPSGPLPPWRTADFGYVRFVGRHHNERGRHPTVADRLDAVLAMRERLAALPRDAWDTCFVVVTNTFEGNAVDSLPGILAAIGETDLAQRCTREPTRPLLPDG